MSVVSVSPSLPCLNCGTPAEISVVYMDKYFRGEPIKCSNCNQKMDWWKSAVEAAKNNFMQTQMTDLIGAKGHAFLIEITPFKSKMVDFSEFGLPSNAIILSVNYTAQGDSNILIVEHHGNSTFQRSTGCKRLLHPIILDINKSSKLTKFSVFVKWVDPDSLDPSYMCLTDACNHFVNANYADAIIPANAAVEIAVSILTQEVLSKQLSKKKLGDLMSNLTYSQMLNGVLMATIFGTNINSLDNEILSDLNTLRKTRNTLAHEGISGVNITKQKTSRLLCAAIFGYHYTKYIFSEISS